MSGPPAAIGPYAIVRELGRGAMGVVLEAEDTRSGRRVALKLLLEADADPEALTRFGREAELLARVRHVNVVRIHELGRAAQGPFIALERVEGESLADRLVRGPLPPEEAVALVRALADALVAVHAGGILHRDIKPANVFVRPDGSPVLLDFGIARDAAAQQRLTVTGALLGSPAYMAPEQADGMASRLLDARTDVYGLGALLFTCLAAAPPFTGVSAMQVLQHVLASEPSWPAHLSPAISSVLRTAMAKDRAGRYPTAAALRDALDAALRGEALAAASRARRGPVAVLAAIALLAVGGGLWAARPAPRAEVSDPAPVTSGVAVIGAAEGVGSADATLEPLPDRVPRRVELGQPQHINRGIQGRWCVRFVDEDRLVVVHGRAKGSEVQLWSLSDPPRRLDRLEVPCRTPTDHTTIAQQLAVAPPERPVRLFLPTDGPALAQIGITPEGSLAREGELALSELPYAAAASPDGASLAIATLGVNLTPWVEVWDLATPRQLVRWNAGPTPGGTTAPVGALAWSADGRTLLAVTDTQGVPGYDSEQQFHGGWSAWTLEGAAARELGRGRLRLAGKCAVTSWDGATFLVGSGSYEVYRLRLEEEEPFTFEGIDIAADRRDKGYAVAHSETLRGLAVARRPPLLVSVSGQTGVDAGGDLRFWDVDGGGELGGPWLRDVAPKGFDAVAFSPSGRRLAVGATDRGVLWFELRYE